MAQTSWQFGDNFASVTPGDAAWNFPGDTATSNNTYGNVALALSGVSEYLRIRFPTSVWSEIPASSTITLIEVRVEAKYDTLGAGFGSCNEAGLYYNDSTSLTGDNRADVGRQYLTTDDFYITGNTPGEWGINSANVATIANYVWYRVAANSPPACTAYIDAISVRLTYTPPIVQSDKGYTARQQRNGRRRRGFILVPQSWGNQWQNHCQPSQPVSHPSGPKRSTKGLYLPGTATS